MHTTGSHALTQLIHSVLMTVISLQPKAIYIHRGSAPRWRKKSSDFCV